MLEVLLLGMISGDPNFDNSPVLTNIINNCTTDCVIHIPKGKYYFNTPMPSITKTIAIIGDGMNSTVLYKNYSAKAPFFSWIGGNASRMENVTLGAWSGYGTTALELKSQDNGSSPDFFDAKNINITVYNKTTWAIGIDLNGVHRARQAPSGLRNLNIDNVFVFGCTTASLNINTVHGAKIYGQFFLAGGTTNKIMFNAWSDDKNTGIILESPILGPVQLWNTIMSTIITYSVDSINNIGSAVKIP